MESSINNPIPPERCWIKFQLNLRGIKYEAIASKARRTEAFVSQVVCGRRKSEKVESVLADVLGYSSWNHLWANAFINTGRTAI